VAKFKCSICGYVYDESIGIPDVGIAPGTRWEDMSDDFKCPVCTVPKMLFKAVEEASSAPAPAAVLVPVSSLASAPAQVPTSAPISVPAPVISPVPASASAPEEQSPVSTDITGFCAGELSAIFSNLAKGCEKQRLLAEMEAANRIADYFKAHTALVASKGFDDLAVLVNDDLSFGIPAADRAAKGFADRGAQRSLVWSEKVSTMIKALLERYAREGDALLENTKVYVCDICGFIHIGDEPPEICPVCKVPSFKISPIGRS